MRIVFSFEKSMKKNQLTASFQLENVPFNIKSYRFECNYCNACSQTIMTHHFALGIREKVDR